MCENEPVEPGVVFENERVEEPSTAMPTQEVNDESASREDFAQQEERPRHQEEPQQEEEPQQQEDPQEEEGVQQHETKRQQVEIPQQEENNDTPRVEEQPGTSEYEYYEVPESIDEVEVETTEEIPEGGYLEGEELARELAKLQKMLAEAREDVKWHYRNTPFVGDFLRHFKSQLSKEDFKKCELRIAATCMPHPYPL